jgi:Flp pilus assembly protein TadB
MIYAFAAILSIIPLLNLILPSFERQKRASTLAFYINKSDSEISRLKQNAFVRSLGDRMQKGKWLDSIFGKKNREMYDALGYTESYEHYLAKSILLSSLILPIPIFFAFATKVPFFAVMSPVLVGMMMFSYLRKINIKYKERQNRIIRDLPNLISKISIALEVGQPLVRIFQEVCDDCEPLLAELLKKLIANTNVMPMRSALQLFAQDINIPVMYDFVSVVNVIIEKGFHEAEDDLNSIQIDLKELRRLSLIERTKGNPEKMNLFYGLAAGHVIIFLFLMAMVMFAGLNSI